MATTLDVGSWRDLGEHRYRSVKVFSSMAWDDVESLDDYVVAVAPNGGPVALTKNPARMTLLRLSGTGATDTITICSQSGRLLHQLPMPKHTGRLLGMSWTATESLVVVFDDGNVDLISAQGVVSSKSFSLFSSTLHERVEMYATGGNGLAAVTRTSDGRCCLYAVYDMEGEDRMPVLMDDIGLPPATLPTAMAVIDGTFTADGRMEILLATPTGSIVVIDSTGGAVDQRLDDVLSAVVLRIAVAPSAKYVALFGEDGSVTVVDVGFEQKWLEFQTKGEEQPAQMVWCGNDSVALTWPDRGVFLIGPFGDWMTYDYDTAVCVAQEVDGLRIVSSTGVDFVHMVPKQLQAIRNPGSAAPAALLVAAAAQFDKEDAGCDDTMRLLITNDTLTEAVTDCIIAATHEWPPLQQQDLLRAASYGKNFDMEYDSNVLVDACKKIRVMNTLRSYDVSMPVTVAQYDLLTAPVIIDRLAARHNFKTALQMCSYLALPKCKDAVLVHWACAKVRRAEHESEESIIRAIQRNLAGVAGVSFADIAAAADSAGRRKLATLLLDFEPRISDRVPILLKMREGPLALQKALESGDTDLVYLALLHLRRQVKAGINPLAPPGSAASSASMLAASRKGMKASLAAAGGAGGRGRGGGYDSDGDGRDDDGGGLDGDDLSPDQQEVFMRIVLTYPAVVDPLAAYYKAHGTDHATLVNLYLSVSRHADAGHALLAAAYASTRLELRLRLLRQAAKVFGDGEKAAGAVLATAGKGTAAAIAATADRSACAFYKTVAEEQAALGESQATVEQERGSSVGAYVDLPLNDTLASLLAEGDTKKVAELRKSFKVPDSTFWQVKIRALAGARDWEGLAKFAEERSPIGYRPFVEACMEENATVWGTRLAEKIADVNERMDMYVQLGAITAAADLAFKLKDVDRLNALGEMAKTPAAIDTIEKYLATLTGGGGRR